MLSSTAGKRRSAWAWGIALASALATRVGSFELFTADRCRRAAVAGHPLPLRLRMITAPFGLRDDGVAQAVDLGIQPGFEGDSTRMILFQIGRNAFATLP
jgi:hypothetical protein